MNSCVCVYVWMLTYLCTLRDHHCHPLSLSTIFFVETWSYCRMLAGQPVPRFTCFSISPSSGTADVGHCKWFLCEFSILTQHHLRMMLSKEQIYDSNCWLNSSLKDESQMVKFKKTSTGGVLYFLALRSCS